MKGNVIYQWASLSTSVCLPLHRKHHIWGMAQLLMTDWCVYDDCLVWGAHSLKRFNSLNCIWNLLSCLGQEKQNDVLPSATDSSKISKFNIITLKLINRNPSKLAIGKLGKIYLTISCYLWSMVPALYQSTDSCSIFHYVYVLSTEDSLLVLLNILSITWFTD